MLLLLGICLPRGDYMDNNKYSYLESLIQWGDEAKQTLQDASIPERASLKSRDQLENWQNKITEFLRTSKEVTENDLHSFQTEGEQIVTEITMNEKNRNEMKQVPIGKHQLPPLPYAYNALEPYISEKIMRLHHDIHHKSYVDGLNEAEKALYKNKPDEKLIKHWLREQAFNGSGHYLHTIFWNNMSPNSSKEPAGEIRKRMDQDFTSWSKFKLLFTEVASSVEGVGWAVLVWQPRSGRLGIQSYEKHQMFQLADTIPLLVLDMWEHAYYLQYETDKDTYIKNWWNIVNWKDVNERYVEAKKVLWPLF